MHRQPIGDLVRAVELLKEAIADSEEKCEPVSDIDTAAADSLKVLDPKRPIREADLSRPAWNTEF